jgi:hypothetical protein
MLKGFLLWPWLENDKLVCKIRRIIIVSPVVCVVLFYVVNTGIDEDLYGANGSEVAKTFHNHLLSRYVPALSHAAGSTKLNNLNNLRKLDMNNTDFKEGWPQQRGPREKDKNWRHSDSKDIAYRYVYQLYDTWVAKG